MPLGLISNGKNKTIELETWVGNPPVQGDKWNEIDSNGNPIDNWVFNGNHWLSLSKDSSFNFINITDTQNIILTVYKAHDLFIKSVDFSYNIDGKNETNKYWKFNLYRVSDTFAFTLISSLDSLSRNYDSLKMTINQQDLIGLNNTLYYIFQPEAVGNTGILSVSGKLNYCFSKI